MKINADSADGIMHDSATLGLAVLTCINLFNYLDRYLVSALAQSLKSSSLALTDFQLGLLMTGFLVVYMLAAPAFGAWGDERSRPRLIAAGVACWSVATALSGAVYSFWALMAARAAVGVGEAAYGTIAPGLLADYFRRNQRGRIMAVFVCAIPVGSALGYMVGGIIDKHFGWAHGLLRRRCAGIIAGAAGCVPAGPAARRHGSFRRYRGRAARAAMGPYPPHRLAQILQSDGARLRRLYLCHRRARLLDALVPGTRAWHAARAGHGELWRHRSHHRLRRHFRRRLARRLPDEIFTPGLPMVVGHRDPVRRTADLDRPDHRLEHRVWRNHGCRTIVSVAIRRSDQCHGGESVLAAGARHGLCPVHSGHSSAGRCHLPSLIGWLSDASSLAQAIQIVPLAIVVAAALWMLAARAQAVENSAGDR